MFINIGKVKIIEWSPKQFREAISFVDPEEDIMDLPHPEILPTMGSNEIERLVDNTLKAIADLKPSVINIEGDNVFCHKLVKALASTDIICIEGSYTDDGEFCQFRIY